MTIILSSCGNTKETKISQSTESTTQQQIIPVAERIKIDGLRNALTKLKNGQTEYKFIGITSNGIDCIYFMYENGIFNIEFEAMLENQLPYIEKLKDFANSNKFKNFMKTYNNTPKYNSDKPAPVLRIETNSSLDSATELGEKIEREIFGNNKETVYEVVP
jgi:hypothetical protein